MSRIDELISELCPSGVTFKTIGEISEVTPGATPSKSVAAYWTGGTIPWLSSGEVNKGTIYEADTLITQSGYDSCSTKMIPAGAVVMALAGQGKTRGTVARTRLECCTNQSLASIVPNTELDSDFLFYFLKTQYSRLRDVSSGDGTRGGLNLAMIRAFRVPVPPLEVQQEIVRILDQFTQLEAELEAGLEAELEARRRQYEHYRALILSPTPEWRETTIGALAEVFDGPHATPKKTTEGPWYLSISSLKDGSFDFTSSAHLSEVDLPRWTKRVAPQPGDTLFSYETRLGQAAYWQLDEPAALGRRMGLLRPKVDKVRPKFLTIAYLSPQFQSVLAARTVRGSTVDRIPIANLGDWPISIPALPEQDRIIGLLEKLDLLAGDLNDALPTELAARRKQYEYYRDKLLTFDEVTA
ncbi:restriction endonuclease subunit S [Rhodococcus ruber]|uniref:restriction endonuclease subunit S n=1 Tax=Rhodococcus ruber TaxID=1830 RepID=UPI001F3CA5F5|nr:restriction endonuclease subunit S [Rhodococcus ruber]MCF8785238.1 restriction endonuclease subunit S [Rhodococcus ruber]